MSQRSDLSIGTIAAICMSLMAGTVAASLAVEWAQLHAFQEGLTHSLRSTHFVASAASTPAAVAIARRADPSLSLSGALLMMLVGIGMCVTTLALTVGVVLLSLGLQLVLSVLLAHVWRAPSRSPAALLLAGVFAVHYVIGTTLDQNGLFAEIVDRWGASAVAATSLPLVAAGTLAVLTCRGREPRAEEAGFNSRQLTGAFLALGSIGTLSLQEVSVVSVLGLAAITCLVFGMGLAATGRSDNELITTHLDVRVLFLVAAALTLSLLVTVAGIEGLWTQPISFDRPDAWRRFLHLIVALHAIPLVFVVLRRGRRWLATGPFALAVGAGISYVSATPDAAMTLIEFASREILFGWGIAIIIGAAAVFAVRSPGGHSIETGAVALLALLPIVERLAVRLAASMINPALIDLEGGTDVRPFIVVGIVGQLALATWWFVRESRAAVASPTTHTSTKEPVS